MSTTIPDDPFQARLDQRLHNSLETKPVEAHTQPHGNIPNTPLASAIISFCLGSIFTLSALLFFLGGLETHWWATYQLGFFIAMWSAFHWLEFAVTAGWNRSKLSIDCASCRSKRREYLSIGLFLQRIFLTMAKHIMLHMWLPW